MKPLITFPELLGFAREYLRDPCAFTEYNFVRSCHVYFAQFPSTHLAKLLRLRLFINKVDSLRAARIHFRAYAAREWLIRFTRSATSLNSGLDSRRCRSGFQKSADASSARISLVGRATA